MHLECYFSKDSESDPDFYNCNLSLVDGFGAAVTCQTANGGWPGSYTNSAVLGCSYNLMEICDDNLKDDGCKCCKNDNSAYVSNINAANSTQHIRQFGRAP